MSFHWLVAKLLYKIQKIQKKSPCSWTKFFKILKRSRQIIDFHWDFHPKLRCFSSSSTGNRKKIYTWIINRWLILWFICVCADFAVIRSIFAWLWCNSWISIGLVQFIFTLAETIQGFSFQSWTQNFVAGALLGEFEGWVYLFRTL